jgi:hypothetical protein
VIANHQQAGTGFGDAVFRILDPVEPPKRDDENLVAVAQLDVPLASSGLPESK